MKTVVIKVVAAALGFISVSIAAFAFVALLGSIVMGFKVGWGSRGPMDPGWGIAVIITAAICFVAGLIGLSLINIARRKNPSQQPSQ